MMAQTHPSGRPVVLPDRAAGRASFDPYNEADQFAAVRVMLAIYVALWVCGFAVFLAWVS